VCFNGKFPEFYFKSKQKAGAQLPLPVKHLQKAKTLQFLKILKEIEAFLDYLASLQARAPAFRLLL
jgi:hypothetical protein